MALEPRSASNPATRRWLANASCSNAWACTTFACVEGNWAPGYYYVLFEDPDGIRLEVNFVPGAGLLADGTQFNAATGYV